MFDRGTYHEPEEVPSTIFFPYHQHLFAASGGAAAAALLEVCVGGSRTG